PQTPGFDGEVSDVALSAMPFGIVRVHRDQVDRSAVSVAKKRPPNCTSDSLCQLDRPSPAVLSRTFIIAGHGFRQFDRQTGGGIVAPAQRFVITKHRDFAL